MAVKRGLALGVIAAVGALVVLVALLTLLYVDSRPVPVPSVTRMEVAEARAVLEDAGLALGDARDVATDSVREGLIVEQDPAASVEARRGDAVDVTVAVAPGPAAVPDVVGSEVEQAVVALQDALYDVRSIEVHSPEVTSGEVIAQLPEAGTEWTTGRPVGIAVSAGPDDGSGAIVPDLIGMDQASAELAVEQAGLVPATFVVTMQSTSGRTVIRQLPEPGTSMPAGGTVLLLLPLT